MPESPPQPDANESVEVSIDIACPECEYNLRGLTGPIVSCPECGLRVDVPELAARQWDKPWYKAPGFTRVVMPAAWAWLASFVVVLVGSVLEQDFILLSAVIAAPAAVWVWLMVRASTTLTDRWASFGVGLFSHAVVLGYMFGLLIGFPGVLFIVEGIVDAKLGDAGFGLGGLLVGVGILWLSRFCEKTVARVCIRDHLKHPPRPA